MKIEGDHIIFADGKKMYADEGCISVDNAGDICTGYSDGVMPGDLTDQERWELARFMVDRWMGVRARGCDRAYGPHVGGEGCQGKSRDRCPEDAKKWSL